jgi:hypothetical protein
LNPVKGYGNILVIQDVLSDFVILCPTKTKKNKEVSHYLLYNVFQHFNISRVISDNGPAFRSQQWLKVMAALRIKILPSASLHPQGRGQVERLVQTVKEMMSKILATSKDYMWEYLPYVVSKVLNNSISPKTGFMPAEMVLGKDGAGAGFLDFDAAPQPHPFVRAEKEHIVKITQQIREMTSLAQEKLIQICMIRNEKLNKNKIVKEFAPGDYVFCLDTLQVPGNSRPLKTRLSPSPYVVIRPLWTTTLVKRLSDGFLTIYSNDLLKLYDKTSPYFSGLPKEVSSVLLHKFSDLLDSDLLTICKFDDFKVPTGIQNYDFSEHEDNRNDDDDQNDDSDEDVSVGEDNKDKGKGKKVADPQPSTSQVISSSDSDDSDEDDENVMVLRNNKKVVRFQEP